MNRTTIVLDPSLKKKAIKRARELQISMGELIRVSIDRFLKEPQDIISSSDSFFTDNVVYKDSETSNAKVDDNSLNHDKYLYED